MRIGERFAGRFELTAGAFAAGISCVAAAITLYFVWLLIAIGYVDVPWVDQWAHLIPDELLQLFSHHNEHLIFFPRLIYWIDDTFFAGRDQFNIAMTLLIQAGHVALFVLLARGLGFRSPAALTFVGGMTTVFLFAPCQRANFIWGFQVQFILAFAAFSAGAYALSRFAVTNNWIWAGCTIIAGIIGAGSMANGLVALPLLTLLALALRRFKLALVLLLAGIAAFATYAHGGLPFGSLNAVHTSVARKIAFGLVFLSNPLLQTLVGQVEVVHGALPGWHMYFAVAAGGAVAIGSVFAIYYWLVRFRSDGGRPALLGPGFFKRLARYSLGIGVEEMEAWASGLALTSIILFVYADTLLAMLGRTRFGTQAAIESRYATAIMPLMVSALLLFAQAWRGANPSYRLVRWAALAFGLVLLLFAARAAPLPRMDVGMRDFRERVALALAVGIQDDDLLPLHYLSRDRVLAGDERIRKDHKWIFSEPWVQALGRPLGDIADRGVGGRCEGEQKPLAALPPSTSSNRVFAPSGEVWASHDQHPTSRLVLVDSKGEVVGLGEIRASPADIKAGGIRRKHVLVPWSGEIRPQTRGEVTAYLLIDDGHKACAIGTAEAGSAAGSPPS